MSLFVLVYLLQYLGEKYYGKKPFNTSSVTNTVVSMFDLFMLASSLKLFMLVFVTASFQQKFDIPDIMTKVFLRFLPMVLKK